MGLRDITTGLNNFERANANVKIWRYTDEQFAIAIQRQFKKMPFNLTGYTYQVSTVEGTAQVDGLGNVRRFTETRDSQLTVDVETTFAEQGILQVLLPIYSGDDFDFAATQVPCHIYKIVFVDEHNVNVRSMRILCPFRKSAENVVLGAPTFPDTSKTKSDIDWVWESALDSEAGPPVVVDDSGAEVDQTARDTANTALQRATANKTKLDTIAEGAEVNTQADWDETDTTADSFIQNKPAIPDGMSGVTFTQTEKDKLAGIEAGAQVDPTASETRDALGTLKGSDRLDGENIKNSMPVYPAAGSRSNKMPMFTGDVMGFVDGLRRSETSQAAYTALSTKSGATVYIISEGRIYIGDDRLALFSDIPTDHLTALTIPAWQQRTAYGIGQLVRHTGGAIYAARQDIDNSHTSGPDADTSNWGALDTYRGQWAAGYYAAGQIVADGGEFYAAKVNISNSDTDRPSELATKWELISSGGNKTAIDRLSTIAQLHNNWVTAPITTPTANGYSLYSIYSASDSPTAPTDADFSDVVTATLDRSGNWYEWIRVPEDVNPNGLVRMLGQSNGAEDFVEPNQTNHHWHEYTPSDAASGFKYYEYYTDFEGGQIHFIELSDNSPDVTLTLQIDDLTRNYSIDPSQIKQAGATDGQALVWSNTNQEWEPGTVASSGGGGGQTQTQADARYLRLDGVNSDLGDAADIRNRIQGELVAGNNNRNIGATDWNKVLHFWGANANVVWTLPNPVQADQGKRFYVNNGADNDLTINPHSSDQINGGGAGNGVTLKPHEFGIMWVANPAAAGNWIFRKLSEVGTPPSAPANTLLYFASLPDKSGYTVGQIIEVGYEHYELTNGDANTVTINVGTNALESGQGTRAGYFSHRLHEHESDFPEFGTAKHNPVGSDGGPLAEAISTLIQGTTYSAYALVNKTVYEAAKGSAVAANDPLRVTADDGTNNVTLLLRKQSAEPVIAGIENLSFSVESENPGPTTTIRRFRELVNNAAGDDVDFRFNASTTGAVARQLVGSETAWTPKPNPTIQHLGDRIEVLEDDVDGQHLAQQVNHNSQLLSAVQLDPSGIQWGSVDSSSTIGLYASDTQLTLAEARTAFANGDFNNGDLNFDEETKFLYIVVPHGMGINFQTRYDHTNGTSNYSNVARLWNLGNGQVGNQQVTFFGDYGSPSITSGIAGVDLQQSSTIEVPVWNGIFGAHAVQVLTETAYQSLAAKEDGVLYLTTE